MAGLSAILVVFGRKIPSTPLCWKFESLGFGDAIFSRVKEWETALL
mgnify:CR=1|tara:strand:+ start:312 stop:449 length:138 start_codon:yes stop_codon:yes gene_type:complete